MSSIKNNFLVYLTFGLMIFAFAARTDAQMTRNERDVRDVLRGVNSKLDDFRGNLDGELNRGSINREKETEINDDLENFEGSVKSFDQKFQARRENAADVTEILRTAESVSNFLNLNRFGGRLQNDWTEIRGLLDRLAANYGIRGNRNNRNGRGSNDNANGSRFPNDSSNDNRFPNANRPSNDFPQTRAGSSDSNLSGNYKLDASRSENAVGIAERAIGSAATDSVSRGDLENKLKAPEQLTIEVRGNQVTLTSPQTPQMTLTADGRDQTENVGGKMIRVRATLRGQELIVSSLGGDNDYTVTFASIENGSAMRVTRRVTTDYLKETVFAESIYQKTDSVARPGADENQGESPDAGYSSNDRQDDRNNRPNGNFPTASTGRIGEFIVANGTLLTGVLENDIDTGVSQNNDRFRLTVQAPNEYRGAVVEGYLSGINRSGKVSGRSQITFNFERIKLANGRTYDFAGFVQNITDETGKTVKVDTEGTARGGDQTRETVKRGGIGAGLGAILGAVIGGGQGAAIGAVIGGGAGAGSVVLQGRDDLKLKKGSSITVQSSSSIR